MRASPQAERNSAHIHPATALQAGVEAATRNEPMFCPESWSASLGGWFELGYLASGDKTTLAELFAAAKRSGNRAFEKRQGRCIQLYVPVTRKVSLTREKTCTKTEQSHTGQKC